MNNGWMFLSRSPPAGHSKSIEDMDMNVVRLCFQCELERKDGDRIPLAPVVSNPIYDKSKSKTYVRPKTYSTKVLKFSVVSWQMMIGLFVFVWLEATTTAELKINRLNVVRGPCTGKTEIYMLCDKVQKGNWTWYATYNCSNSYYISLDAIFTKQLD